MLVVVECNDYQHAPYGESDLSNIDNTGGSNSSDDNSTDDTEDSETEELICEDDEVLQPGTTNCWRRCPVGQEWNSKVCEGFQTLTNWQDAQIACSAINSAYHLSTLVELISVLSNCDKQIYSGSEGICDYCTASPVCLEMFDYDSNTYWTSTVTQQDTDAEMDLWTVSFENGMVQIAYFESQLLAARCLRSL